MIRPKLVKKYVVDSYPPPRPKARSITQSLLKDSTQSKKQYEPSGINCVLGLVPVMIPKYPKMHLRVSSIPKFAQGSHRALK
jgi:hypothetical protein